MKKILCSIMLLIGILLEFTDSTISKATQSESQEKNVTVVDFAAYNVNDLLLSHLISSGKMPNGNDYSVAYPIIHKCDKWDVYDFPIFKNGTIVSVLKIFTNKNDFNAQIESGSISDIVSSIGDSDVKMIHRKNKANTNLSKKDNNLDEKDLKIENLTPNELKHNVENRLEVLKRVTFSSDSISKKAAAQKVLPLVPVAQTEDGRFNSPEMKWCAEAACASIINYKKGASYTAKDMVWYAFGAFLDKGLTPSEVASMGNKFRLSPVVGNPLDYASVKKRINSKDPIYMALRTANDDRHGVVLAGYDSKEYTIINSWKSTPITILKKNKGSDVKLYHNNEVFSWRKSVYNWR